MAAATLLPFPLLPLLLLLLPAPPLTSGAHHDQCPRWQASTGRSCAPGPGPGLDGQPEARSKLQPFDDRVQLDPEGRRWFEARIVGIFSCLSEAHSSQASSADLSLDIRLAKPAIDLAVEHVNQRYRQLRFNVTYRSAPEVCRHQQAAGHAADEYFGQGANYFVGPGCSESLAGVGQLASYWDVPVCSNGYLPEMVTSGYSPNTLVQLSLSVQSVGEMLLELFQLYDWRHLVIVTDEKHPLHSLIRDGLLEFFHTMHKQAALPSASVVGQRSAAPTAANLNPNPNQQQQQQQPTTGPNLPKQRLPYYINITSRNFGRRPLGRPIDYGQVMLDAAAYSRVMLLLAHSSTIRRLLEGAHEKNMSRSQFVYIAHELLETQMLDGGSSPPAGLNSLTGSAPSPPGWMQQQQQQQQHQQQQQQQHQPGPSAKQRYALDDKIEIQPGGHSNNNNNNNHNNNYHTNHNGSNNNNNNNNHNNYDNDTNDEDELTRQIFQSLMTISLKIPTTPEFDTFRAQLVERSEREFSYTIPSSFKSRYSLGVAALIYDCVLLYADKVHHVLNRTQLQRVTGSTVFQLLANRTFTNALTGNLTINSNGQRVIDFTLNDFSPQTLSLEPIAQFKASELALRFIDGKQPHWEARKQPRPRSEPRCRISDGFCRFTGASPDDFDPELLQANSLSKLKHSTTDRVLMGVWVAATIVVSVAFTSSIIGWFVYRRFRIESELLNLWWSIKYEDILFDEEPDEARCDGKRSMSSLAISTESFPAPAGGALPADSAAAAAAAAASQPLADCSSLGPLSQPGEGAGLAAYSSSSLSVAAGAPAAAAAPACGVNRTASGPSSSHAQQQQQQHQHGNKLFPPLNKQSAGGSAGRAGTGSRSCDQIAAKFSSRSTTAANAAAAAAAGAGSAAAAAQQPAANRAAKDPSISSQNKNLKLRLGTVLNGGRDHAHPTKVGLYKASRVAAKHLNVRNLNINRQLLIELRQVRDLTHENLIKFIGLCPEEPNVAIVSELCTRGNLQDLLQNESIRLDWPFRYSIINDIVDGLIHLHSSPIQYHGRLKSTNCVIDNRFVVKITDFGLASLMASVSDEEELETQVNPRLLLWTAPEHLRTKRPLLAGSQRGDIYSLAIIFQEIITRCGPFECEPILCGASELGALDVLPGGLLGPVAPVIRTLDARGHPLLGPRAAARRGPAVAAAAATTRAGPATVLAPLVVQHKQRLEPEEIVNLVRMGLSPPFRPYFRPDVVSAIGGPSISAGGAAAAAAATTTADFNLAELIAIVQSCWQEAPQSRPHVASVKQQIKKVRRGAHLEGSNLMDNLLQRMERYTDNLESLVEQKTAELTEEKKRSEELLYEMLPRFVVDQLKYGHSVTPEAYEAVTISFSDIKDFTSIAARSSPIEVVNLLNQLYTEFDDCIACFDVYKVETIGDAYMVVSGLPVRNGDQHAGEIADMSLALLDLICNFRIAHLPQVKLELRIGIHSGPCASGVVGTRMFRYCLFGDTVNTASRMESHGEPMKVHISEDSAAILAKFGTFLIEPRGQLEIKGKGLMNTFWLTGKRAS